MSLPQPRPLPDARARIDRAALAIAQTYLEAAYACRARRLAAGLSVPPDWHFRAEIDAIPDAAYSFARALERARDKTP